MRLMRMTWILSASVTAIMVATACGGGEPTSTPKPTVAPTPSGRATASPIPTPTPQPATTAPASDAKPARGGVLQYPLGAPLATPDPSKTQNYTTFFGMAAHVFSTLMKTKERFWTDIELEGDLAQSWTVSPDGKKYTFSMRPEARWQNLPPVNGRAVTSGDVKWTWQLITTPAYASAHRSRWPDAIQSMDAPDDKTLIVTLKQPFAPFLLGMADPRLKILPREVHERDGSFEKAPVGSGAFIFDKYDTGVRVVNKANPSYWKMGADGRALPYVDAIEVLVMTDPAAVLANIKAGRLGFTTQGSLELDDAESLKRSNPEIKILQLYNLATYILRMNQGVKPWDNEKVRLATLKAIDQEALRRDIWRQPDSPLDGAITSGIREYALGQDELKELLKFDPKGAKQLLQEAGLASGFAVQLGTQFSGGVTSEAILSFLAQSLNDIGIRATPFIAPGGPAGGGELLQQRKYEIMFSTFPQEGNPWNYLRPHWSSAGSTNFLNLNDPELDKMIDAAEADVDPARQIEQAKQIQRHVLRRAYVVPLPHGWMFQHQQPWLKNFARSWPWGHKGLEQAWIQK